MDLLKIIQLGITIADADGKMPDFPTWQFNFKFDLKLVSLYFSLRASNYIHSDDMYAPDSIELLTKSGINFKRLEANGIDIEEFGEKLVTSGFVLFDHVHWISFHRCVQITTQQTRLIYTVDTILVTYLKFLLRYHYLQMNLTSLIYFAYGSLAYSTSSTL